MKEIILFDGVCVLCNRAVQFILRHDTKETVFFSSLQSDYAQRWIAAHPALKKVDSLIFIRIDESGLEFFFTRSNAVLEIVNYLGGVWKLFLFGKIFPRVLRDAVYDRVAKIRYAVFGRYDVCPVPTDDIRSRLME